MDPFNRSNYHYYTTLQTIDEDTVTNFEQPAFEATAWPAVNPFDGWAQFFGTGNNNIDTTTYPIDNTSVPAIDNTTAPAINQPAAPQPSQKPASDIGVAAPPGPRKRKARDSADRPGKWRKGDPPLTEKQKAKNHNGSEKARLERIQVRVDELCDVVPELTMGVRKSLAKVYWGTVDCARQIKADRERLALALSAYGVTVEDVLRNGGEAPAPAPAPPVLPAANNDVAGPGPATLEYRSRVANNAVNANNDVAAGGNNLMDAGIDFNAVDHFNGDNDFNNLNDFDASQFFDAANNMDAGNHFDDSDHFDPLFAAFGADFEGFYLDEPLPGAFPNQEAIDPRLYDL
ncbi:MAG: hypothetical protein Q9200_006546 [Gallowayella weberi]